MEPAPPAWADTMNRESVCAHVQFTQDCQKRTPRCLLDIGKGPDKAEDLLALSLERERGSALRLVQAGDLFGYLGVRHDSVFVNSQEGPAQ